MRDELSSREPVNEWDAVQQEDALRRNRQRPSNESHQSGHRSGQRVPEVTFFPGEILTLKGRRLKVSNVIGGRAVVLEAMGDMVLKEGVSGRRQANMVGRRNRAG